MLRLYLQHAGYDVRQSFDGADAIATARDWQPALVVLDLMLPEIAGLDVCAALRKTSDTAIIVLTARTTEEDRLRGLEAGADDYVGKPFSTREVVARVKAVLRRRNASAVRVISCGEIQIDTAARAVHVCENTISLTRAEYGVLLALCRQPGAVRTRDELIEEVLGLDYEGTERTIDVHVRNLRRKIQAAGGSGSRIQSVFGVGYKVECGK